MKRKLVGLAKKGLKKIKNVVTSPYRKMKATDKIKEQKLYEALKKVGASDIRAKQMVEGARASKNVIRFHRGATVATGGYAGYALGKGLKRRSKPKNKRKR